jgi:hypothetical protein
VNYVVPRIHIVDPKTAFDGHWDVDSVNHFLAHLRDKMRVEHQLSSKTAIYCLFTRTAAIQIHFIIAPLLHNFCCLCRLNGTISANLPHDRVLIFCKIKEPLFACFFNMQNSVFI